MTTYSISCYDSKGLSLNHYFVDEAIYIYIKQLETYVKSGSLLFSDHHKNPGKSKLKNE